MRETKYAYNGVGADQAGSSSSVKVTEKNWQDQVDGVSDKWKSGVRKTVRLGEATRIAEERKDEENVEENAVATLSLSVQVPAGNVKTLGENGWREQSSMSQLLEKLRRAAEVSTDPKAEKEVSDDEKWRRLMRRWCRRLSQFQETSQNSWEIDVERAKV